MTASEQDSGQKASDVSGFAPIWSLGLMSGTSMDGIDAALLRTDGEGIAEFGPALETRWTEEESGALQPIAAEPLRYRDAGDLALCVSVSSAERTVELAHARAVLELLHGAGQGADLIGFHGQTLHHAPDEGRTWQLGDGGRLARLLNRPVAWDFRSADMRAGGEGAPLAPFFHFALVRHLGFDEPVCFLNIGGVANVTWVDPRHSAPEAPGALLAFDTGPGNALLDDWMRRKTGAPLDRDGAAAAEGSVDTALLRRWMEAGYFARAAPKSLDRNAFAGVFDALGGASLADGAATLAAFTAESAACAREAFPSAPSRWLVCGGGRRNPTLMRMLRARLNLPVDPVEAVGLDGDMLEAQAFAYLAVRVLRGLPLSAPGTTGCATATDGGRLDRPE